MHCKVCSPILLLQIHFYISPLHNPPLPVPTIQAPESRKKIITFLMIYFIIGLSFFLSRKNFNFLQIRTFLSFNLFENVILTIFPDFLTELKYPPSQITTQCISQRSSISKTRLALMRRSVESESLRWTDSSQENSAIQPSFYISATSERAKAIEN